MCGGVENFCPKIKWKKGHETLERKIDIFEVESNQI
jgi:hypothetical protein